MEVTGAAAGVGVMDLGEAVLAVMDSAEVGVTDSVGEVSAVMDSAAAVLVGEILVASVIAVSAGEIAAFAISKGTLSILASMALDIQITISTTTPITTHTRITTTMPI